MGVETAGKHSRHAYEPADLLLPFLISLIFPSSHKEL